MVKLSLFFSPIIISDLCHCRKTRPVFFYSQFKKTIIMAKEKKPKDSGLQRMMLNRWAFDLAYRLMETYSISRKEAFSKAYLALDLLIELGRGEVHFTYLKQDDTLREARGTLCHGISAAFDNYEYRSETTPGADDSLNFCYWDLDAEGFRSFAVVRLQEISGVVIPNKQEP